MTGRSGSGNGSETGSCFTFSRMLPREREMLVRETRKRRAMSLTREPSRRRLSPWAGRTPFLSRSSTAAAGRWFGEAIAPPGDEGGHGPWPETA